MAEIGEKELRSMTMPNSTEAEISVLGAMLQDSTAVLRATEQLREDDFYLAEHKEIYSAMRELHSDRKPVDLTTVDAELSRRGTLDGIGGDPYLMKLITSVPTTANVRAYIDIVAEKSTLRKLIRACQDIEKNCYTQQNPLQETLASAEKAIFDISMNRTGGDTLIAVKDVLPATFGQIEELSKLHGEISGVPTGFIDLDSYLTGLHSGEFIVVGARPGMGKTSFFKMVPL